MAVLTVIAGIVWLINGGWIACLALIVGLGYLFAKAGEALEDAFLKAIEFIMNIDWSAVGDSIKEAFKNAIEAVKEWFGDLWEWIKEKFSGIWSAIKSVFGSGDNSATIGAEYVNNADKSPLNGTSAAQMYIENTNNSKTNQVKIDKVVVETQARDGQGVANALGNWTSGAASAYGTGEV